MDKVNFKSGDIIYDEFKVDFTKRYSEQKECLLEDLLQVKYAQEYLLDVGWYPEYESEGEFIVQIIKKQNWEEPIYKKSSKDEEELIQNLNNAVAIIESILKIRPALPSDVLRGYAFSSMTSLICTLFIP